MNKPMPTTPEQLLKDVDDRINALQLRQLGESARDLDQWVVMIGAMPIKYEMQDGVAIIHATPGTSRIEDATRFDRARVAHMVASKTRNGKNEVGEALRVRHAYVRCLDELRAVRKFLRDAAISQHEAP